MTTEKESQTSVDIDASTALAIDAMYPTIRGRENKLRLVFARLKEQDEEIKYLRRLLEVAITGFQK